jgi:hypothetical protein
MQVTCVFSLDGKDWQKYPQLMAEKMGDELIRFIRENTELNEKTEFKKAVGTFHDLKGNAIGEIVLEENDDNH